MKRPLKNGFIKDIHQNNTQLSFRYHTQEYHHVTQNVCEGNHHKQNGAGVEVYRRMPAHIYRDIVWVITAVNEHENICDDLYIWENRENHLSRRGQRGGRGWGINSTCAPEHPCRHKNTILQVTRPTCHSLPCSPEYCCNHSPPMSSMPTFLPFCHVVRYVRITTTNYAMAWKSSKACSCRRQAAMGSSCTTLSFTIITPLSSPLTITHSHHQKNTRNTRTIRSPSPTDSDHHTHDASPTCHVGARGGKVACASAGWWDRWDEESRVYKGLITQCTIPCSSISIRWYVPFHSKSTSSMQMKKFYKRGSSVQRGG